jgi:alkanesulfonate monooxygenase SsuD/methylene tetrahydromethanopterin reductase-like flavin-dependent oxidoreductase (luciferase family)
MPLAARYAEEWNALMVTPDELRTLEDQFDQLLDEIGRPRQAVRRSIMLGTILAQDERSLQARLAVRGRTYEEALTLGMVVGTPEMWIEQLTAYAEAGADRIMLQWLDQEDIDGLELVAREILPALRQSPTVRRAQPG